jgi:hypothetical protein
MAPLPSGKLAKSAKRPSKFLALLPALILICFFEVAGQRHMDRMSVLGCVMAFVLALLTFDLIRALRDGRALGAFGQTITREGRPALFRRWMISQYVLMGLCMAGLVWVGWQVI